MAIDKQSIEREPDQGALSIPVIEEDFVVEKRSRTTATVRVSKTVHRREETVDLPVLRSAINVERTPFNTLLDEQPAVRHEGDVTVYPVFKEVAVVVVKYLLKEEVRISRRETSEPHSESVVLRTEDVVVVRDEQPIDPSRPAPDGTIYLTETVEEPVVLKRARVVEEVSIQKVRSEHTEVVRDTVRKLQIVSEPIQESEPEQR